MTKPLNILNLTQEEFTEASFQNLNRGKDHIKRFYKAFLQTGDGMGGYNPKEPQSLAIFESLKSGMILPVYTIKDARDDGFCAKYVLEFSDAHIAELVVIPMKTGLTLCVSSQVGCKMGCVFCETGRMGKLRDLQVEEILFQVFFAKFIIHKPITNIVFMGMGEPFDNYENVTKALDILIDPFGFNFPASNITVSTSGIIPRIKDFEIYGLKGVKLAVSINGSNDAGRQKVMPVNRLYNMQDLKSALIGYTEKTKKSVLAEYVMLKGINDQQEDALKLASYLKDVPSVINLIPYNAQSQSRFEPPEDCQIKSFQEVLKGIGFKTYIRQNKGNPIMAACGQLGIINLKKSLLKKSSPS
jgi:23S rRNA (adenine2503-C2)-methyltransferase